MVILEVYICVLHLVLKARFVKIGRNVLFERERLIFPVSVSISLTISCQLAMAGARNVFYRKNYVAKARLLIW